MDEWTVVTVIVVLVGLVTAAVKPLISLSGTITRLTEAVKVLEKDLGGITAKNSEAHAKLWQKAGEHDELLRDHEFRLREMEGR